jgi:HTH-type transcriptional regulator, competence development regulator
VPKKVLTDLGKTVKDKLSFAEFIRNMRQERRQPLRVIAAAIGIDSTLLSKLERGNRFPTEVQISKFARLFKVPEAELKGRVMADKMIAEFNDNDAALHAAYFLRGRAIPSKTTARERYA